MILFARLLFISLLFFNTLLNNPKDRSIFISPLKIPLFLSSNFGEIRIDHFHSGLDIKTQSVTGKEVVSTADGYIYRISVSPGGYGKAIHIRHPSGYSTVYGHLDKFSPEIEAYVTDKQYERQNFQVVLLPPKEKFPVKQGEVIAYSGNSGSSGGPHLHYEIRRSDSEVPVNPLLYESEIADSIPPIIEKLAIYPINRNSRINNLHILTKIHVSGGHGKYYIPPDNEIIISGLAGFGIKTFDLMNESSNKCGVYSIELVMDSVTIYKYVMDSFSFYESRFVNSHIDYETFIKENIYIERTFVLPNDKLSIYRNVLNRGVFNFSDQKIHHATIIVKDIRNNKSTLSFNIKAQLSEFQNVSESVDKNLKLMPYNRSNNFTSDNISITIPEGALYDTLSFSYRKTSGTKEMLSKLYYVNNPFTPLHKAYSLSIKPDTIPAGKESKMLIIQLGDDQKKNAISSKWSDGNLTAECQTFGKFYIGIDSIAPVISPIGINSGSDLTEMKEIKITITDDLSGIKSYEPFIDGKWALFEYDQKNNLLVYKFDNGRIIQGKKHELSLKVTDNMDNVNFYKCDFTW